MIKLFNVAVILGLAAFTQWQPVCAANKVIFGEDDRVDYYQIPAALRGLADSTGGLWKREKVERDAASGTYGLWTSNLGDAYNLCQGEKFAGQPRGAACSGALVGEDLFLTAGHCVVTEADCAGLAVVFGFEVKGAEEKPVLRLPEKDVYFCSKIIKRQLTNVVVSNDNIEEKIYGPDYALIKLDRKVEGRRPLAVNRQGGLKKGTSVFMTGHPLGLPLKFSPNGRIVKDIPADAAYFLTDLDSFGGNSGAPVFNAATGLIEGVHVRGEGQTFIPTFEGCNVYVTRPQNAGFPGAETKIDYVLDVIPALPGEAAAQARVDSDIAELGKMAPSDLKQVSFDR